MYGALFLFLKVCFASNQELCVLTLTIITFHVSLPSKYDDPEYRRDPLVREAIRRFKRQYQSPIQLRYLGEIFFLAFLLNVMISLYRVLNTVRYWVEHHFYDFQNSGDGELLKMLLEFMDSIKSNNLKKWTESIKRTLQRQVSIYTYLCKTLRLIGACVYINVYCTVLCVSIPF